MVIGRTCDLHDTKGRDAMSIKGYRNRHKKSPRRIEGFNVGVAGFEPTTFPTLKVGTRCQLKGIEMGHKKSPRKSKA